MSLGFQKHNALHSLVSPLHREATIDYVWSHNRTVTQPFAHMSGPEGLLGKPSGDQKV
jgi:hypothetical protein